MVQISRCRRQGSLLLPGSPWPLLPCPPMTCQWPTHKRRHIKGRIMMQWAHIANVVLQFWQHGKGSPDISAYSNLNFSSSLVWFVRHFNPISHWGKALASACGEKSQWMLGGKVHISKNSVDPCNISSLQLKNSKSCAIYFSGGGEIKNEFVLLTGSNQWSYLKAFV